MCSKCDNLDKKIAKYRRLSDAVGGLTTINRFREEIWRMQAEKVALHSEEEE
jgi:hypothetical protein